MINGPKEIKNTLILEKFKNIPANLIGDCGCDNPDILCRQPFCISCYAKRDKNMTHIEVNDLINHPKHYISSGAKCSICSSDIECIDITRHMSFNIGNIIKYLWRSDHKGNKLADLKKALWYLNDEIKKIENETIKNNADTYKNTR